MNNEILQDSVLPSYLQKILDLVSCYTENPIAELKYPTDSTVFT